MYSEGLYEKIITKELKNYLEHRQGSHMSAPLTEEEADFILSKHLSEVTKLALKQIEEDRSIKREEKLKKQIMLVNGIINQIQIDRGEEFQGECVEEHAQMLYGIDCPKEMVRPTTPLSQTTLFTNAQNEPNLYHELGLEILSSDRVDLLVSFIKWSGLRCIKEALETYTKDRPLRVITTSYMGASDYHAIEFLASLPNTQVKISYDTKRTKHHAKAYMFQRDTGFSTAYIGSSNLSRSAIENGLEWNIKVTERDAKEVIEKFEATFDTYWNDEEFITFDIKQGDRLKEALNSEKYKSGSNTMVKSTLTPHYYQKEILERLKVEREVYGRYKNLVVAATGVGKTVIAAFDYRRLRRAHPNKPVRLLFVAHKQEILKQSLDTFRRVLMDWNFGELYFNGRLPGSLDYLFVTIQTFNSKKFYEQMRPDYYDMIIVDEFHHAKAKSYQELLAYYKPHILLGLTATPERMDGQNVLEYFENRIATELRLGEAIDNRLLCPFHYFAVTDSIDYSKLEWTKGGYDKNELDKLISADTQRAGLIVQSLYRYLTDIESTRGLGFCTSVNHAQFMCDYFNQIGIASAKLCGGDSELIREQTVADLVIGKIKFIFTVDLFNEGIDIPCVNTILFLRPTESRTVFLQQLGRGLRLDEEKECLTVLDYVGQAHKQYNYYDKLALLSREKGKALKESIQSNHFLLPKGCYMYMEKVAREYILRNIEGYINNKKIILARIKEYSSQHADRWDIGYLIGQYDLELLDIYKIRVSIQNKSMNTTFYRMGIEAGILTEQHYENEMNISSGIGKLSLLTSKNILAFLIQTLEQFPRVKEAELTTQERTWLLMFHYTLWGKSLKECGMQSLKESLTCLYKMTYLYEEVKSILQYNYNHLERSHLEDTSMEDSALEIHGTYTTDQILVALGKHTEEKKYHFQEGVLWVKEKHLDAFFITLNKVEKHYSPSTMYKDYAINDTLFHWQTQSKIKQSSSTFKRYQTHKENGHKILLFVRNHKEENGLTSPFTYLGCGQYVRHYGEKPVNIVWKLEHALPADLGVKAQKAL